MSTPCVPLAAFDVEQGMLIGGIVVTAIFTLLYVVVSAKYGALWFQAYMCGADVSLLSLIGMSFRQIHSGTIVTAQTHMDVLKTPDRISRGVLERGLDTNTAFQIVSIDIADMGVGENIGARLQTDQAEADMRTAQARAEVRRAEAIARQQEMKARVAGRQAQVVLAEAEIPPAIALAFRAGQLYARRPQPDRTKPFEERLQLASPMIRAVFAPDVLRNGRGIEAGERERGTRG